MAGFGLGSFGGNPFSAMPAQFFSQDSGDYTDRYNTPLSYKQEQAFQKWAAANGRSADLADYDLRGWWLQNGMPTGAPKKGEHFTDLFKKPNHPTFSDQSIYHGMRPDTGEWDARLQGGTWQDLGNGKFSFTPGATNLQMHEPQALIDYFNRVEPGNQLILPGQ